MNCAYRVADRERNEQLTLASQVSTRADEQRAGACLRDHREGSLDLVIAAEMRGAARSALQHANCTVCKTEPFSHHGNYISH